MTIVNSNIHWHNTYDELPPQHHLVVALIESDSNDATHYPMVRYVKRCPIVGREEFTWKLVDYNPITEEETLQQSFTVMMWRYIYNSNGEIVTNERDL